MDSVVGDAAAVVVIVSAWSVVESVVAAVVVAYPILGGQSW